MQAKHAVFTICRSDLSFVMQLTPIALMIVVCLSVRLSVQCGPNPNSRMEGRSKLKIGSKEAMTQVKSQRSMSLGRLMLRRIMRHTDRRTSNLVQGWSRITRISDMRGDIKGQRSRSPRRAGWLQLQQQQHQAMRPVMQPPQYPPPLDDSREGSVSN